MKHRDTLFWNNPQIAIIVFLFFYTINTAPAQTPKPAEAIAEKALTATVYLEMKDTNGKTLGIGSGFFVKPNLIATNYHVIEGAAKGTAKLVGKSTTYNIEGVTATDKDSGLALLKVTASGIRPLSLGDSDKVQTGETVYVAGNQKGLEATFSNGIISSKRSENAKEHLQMTAPILPRSSGGPVLNKNGEVIGVSFMTLEGGQKLNFTIPSEYLKKLLKQSKLAKPLSQEKQSISAETYLLWGYVKYGLGYYVGAIKNYTAAIQLKPDDADAYYYRGLAKYELRQHTPTISDFNTAISDLDTAIRLKPDYADAYNNRGLVKGKLRQYAAAILDFDTAIQHKPDYADAYKNRGTTKAELGQYADAITDYDIAIQLNPDDVYAYNNRGNAKRRLGQHDNAISDFDTAIQLNPDDAEAYYNRGVAKAELRQYADAIADYDIAIQLNPDDAYAYNNRGIAKAELGQHAAEIADYDIAIQLQPDLAYAYNNRGVVKNRLGQHTAAIADFDIAIQLQPDLAKAYLYRGVAKTELGQTLAAQQDFNTALKLGLKAGDINLKTADEKALRFHNE